MAKFIYCEPDDEITNLVDRLRGEKAESDLVFIIPASSRVMQSALNARLLMQYSNSLGKKTMVISPDPRTQGAAIETGFSVFPTMADYESGRSIDRVEAAPATMTFASPTDAGVADEGPPPVTSRRTGTPGPCPRRAPRPTATASTAVGARRSFLPYVLAGVGVLLVVVVLVFFVLPTATVSIVTSARSVSSTPTITGSTSAPANASQTVQTTLQQSSQSTSQQRPATGKKDIPAVPATGQVVFHNSSSGTFGCCKFQVPAGTEVYTDDGKKFLTTQDSNQFDHGKDSDPVGVQARAGGQGGNVPADSIKHISTSDAQASQYLSVSNSQPTSNGADATQKTVVSQTDLDTAKRDLGNDLTNKVKDDLNQKGGGQKLIDETLQVTVDANYDHKAGDEADNFKADINVKGQVTTVPEDKLKGVILDALKKQLPAGYTLTDADTPKLEYHVVQKDDKGNIVWDASASAFMAVALNKDDLKKNIVGQSPQKAKSYIQQHVDAADVIIRQSPSFIPWMPFLAARIDISQQVENTTPK